MPATILTYATIVFAFAFGLLFLRGGDVWAILLGVAPFGMLSAFAVWLVTSSYTRAKELEADEQKSSPRDLSHAA